MGQAKITSGGPDGLYNITIVKDAGKSAARLAAIAARLAIIPGLITAAQDAVDQAISNLAAANSAFNIVAYDYQAGTATRKEVIDATNEVLQKQTLVLQKRRDLSMINIEKTSLTKEQTRINASMAVEARSGIWCTDLTENLSAGATVGTMEINGDDSQIILTPGGEVAAALGKLQHAGISTGSAVFCNKALLPCWQKWKPTYRIGTITAIDYETDTCDVGIEAQYSDEQGLPINQAGESWDAIQAAIQGWDDFAAANPDFALVANADSTDLTMTEELKADLDRIQEEVNDRNKYAKDEDQYGKLENWTLMDEGGSGDCEDFALTKAQKLLDLGYPASAIHIEVALTQSGEGHAYLVIQTNHGDLGLDNNYKNVMPSNSLPYKDRRRQTGMNWTKIGVKLRDVPIEYMDGTDASVFLVNDKVVVQFVGQDWNVPKVIGFESNPQGVGYITMLAVFREDVSVIPAKMDIELYSIDETGALTLQKTIHHDPVHDLYSNGIIFTNALSWSIAKQKFISTAVVGTVPDVHVCVDEIALDGTKTSTLYDFNSPYYLSESPVQTGVHGTMDQPVFALQNAADITLTARGKVMTATDNLFHMMRSCGLSSISETPYYNMIKFKSNMTEDFRRDGTLGIRYRTKEGAFIYYNDSGNTGTTAKTCFHIQAGKIHPATISPDVPAYQDFLWTYGYQYLSSKWARLELRRTSIPVAALIADATINIESYPHTTVYTTTNSDNRGGLAYLSEHDTYYFIKNVVLSGLYCRSQIYRCNNAGIPVSTEFLDNNNFNWRDKVCEVLVSMANAKLYGWA